MKPPLSTKLFIRALPGIKHRDVIGFKSLANDIHDTHRCDWTKQASMTLEEATEAYMVEVIAESHRKCRN